MNHIRILLVDDHTLFRSGVKALLQRQEDFEVVGEASDGLEGVKLADTVEADVMLLDMDMPSMNGRDVLEQVHEAHPNLAILMLTVSEDTALLSECLAMGARGYLLKNIDQDFLLRAVRTAAQGESIMSPQMMTKFLERFKASFSHMPTAEPELEPKPAAMPPLPSTKSIPPRPVRSADMPAVVDPSVLTRRERQALAWIARGLSNKEVARGLNLAESTVKVHVQSILRKLNLTSRVQAAVYAIEHGIDKEELGEK